MLLFLPLLTFKSLLTRKKSPGFSIYTGKIVHKTPEGKWSFQLYGNQILKTTFQPEGYASPENLSNAVVAKPSIEHSIRYNEDRRQIGFGNVASVTIGETGYTYGFGQKNRQVSASYFSGDHFRGFRFQLEEDEYIFGGGERALPLSRRGYGFGLYNCPAFGYGEYTHDLNFSVPFIISSKGYGIFFDNPSKGYLDIGRKDWNVLEAGFSSGELNFYIIEGKNVDEILRNYTELVGRQPVPGRWVFGNMMSRYGYRSQEQVMSTVKKMKEENFPIDAVILDLFWFGDSVKNSMGNLDWANPGKWPDPAGMIRELKSQGIRTILITEPYVLMGTKNYGESKPYHSVNREGQPFTLTNFYFGFGGLLDLFRKDAQDWFWTKYTRQIEAGIAGWWGDLGEPETHPSDIHHNLSDLGRKKRLYAADEVHNIYGHHWNKMLCEKYKQDYPAVRLFNLNRSGFAGSQRYCVFPWSGDVGRNWSGFRAQLPIMLGMSLSGIPYIHADAGGFAGGEKDCELYTRWLQFAAFTPVFRPHGTALEDLDPSVPSIESEPVFYPEPYKSIVRRYIQLRYDLLPYNYTLAYQQERDGKPLTRPMFYYDSSDVELLKADNQYMWGDQLLIAPVIEPGASQRWVYLPKGAWYNYFSLESCEGGRWICQQVVIENIPVYVKAGSFIPASPGLRNSDQYSSAQLEVTYYPGTENSSYIMFDDDGATNRSLQKGRYELLRFEARVRPDGYSFFFDSDGGKFQNRPSRRAIHFRIPCLKNAPSSVRINGLDITTFGWDESRKMLLIDLDFAGSKMEVEVSHG